LTDVPELIKSYLDSPLVIQNNIDNIDFTASILVFASMTQEPTGPSSASMALSSSQSTTPMVASSASSLSYDALYREYKALKDEHNQTKAREREKVKSKKR
jgi:hypothetical protein